MDEEGMAEDLRDSEWDEVWELLRDLPGFTAFLDDPAQVLPRLQQFGHINELLKLFLAKKTKQQIFDEASERRVMMVPVQNARDLSESPQLEALGYFHDVGHPELGATLRYPGPPYYHISETPWRISRRAPLIGEHNLEVYEKELGISREELAILKQAGTI
jgi:crotonobetainyl-CoA:carnitine CoA-transferase CaiB-like acyl-CoA transferase